jgi:MIP family channel proteins
MLKRCTAEAIGTFGIVFFGCGAIMVAERFPGTISTAAISVVFGLVVSAMIYTLGHISGAHFNPAVTLAFAITRHFPFRSVLLYWIAQSLGSIVAASILYLILPHGIGYGETVPHVPLLPAFMWELVLTFTLMFVVMGVAKDSRAVGTLAGLVIGATVSLTAFVGGPITGDSMNPARSLGPAIASGRVDVLWLYILAPMAGAVLGALTYQWVRGEREPQA